MVNRASKIARENLKEAQSRMKKWYDKDTEIEYLVQETKC